MRLPLLYPAWLIAIVATLGSLYFSEVRMFVPCVLCWYQRILMYPLVLILGVTTYRQDGGDGLGERRAMRAEEVEEHRHLDGGVTGARDGLRGVVDLGCGGGVGPAKARDHDRRGQDQGHHDDRADGHELRLLHGGKCNRRRYAG